MYMERKSISADFENVTAQMLSKLHGGYNILTTLAYNAVIIMI